MTSPWDDFVRAHGRPTGFADQPDIGGRLTRLPDDYETDDELVQVFRWLGLPLYAAYDPEEPTP
ncbi:hypothetical protein [Amycolatopsis suaedae]|uniref:Uncharacterized protein n=1 Tax=Amycolatopsis suaedae TaxID=2510978 RepID=A0A4V2EKZ9_9PSEU|nr:hypothetical protein [Amycolatopsis suaedae]RZQ59825.1 hypothetical protein EWH70_32435 [Amycolatopsis suaedae]